MSLLIAYFCLATTVSFLCSLLESVILSVSPAYIAVAEKEGLRSAKLMARLKREVNRPLAAILTINTFANMVGAAGVGAQALKIYGDEFVAVFSAGLTLTILIFSEIIPKTLGATHWKGLAPICTYIIWWMILFTFPFVLLAEKLSLLLSKSKQRQVTRAEMIETAEIGVTEGTLRKKESAVIKNLLMLDNIFVSDIMTPRSVIFALSKDLTCLETVEKYRPIRYSRIPVYSETLDRIEGMVHRYKILEAVSNDDDEKKISEVMTPVMTVHENMTISSVLDEFIKKGKHLFIAVDDYGVVSGIVTLEDAIETLLGVEIVDEFDSVADLRQHALELWKKRKYLSHAQEPTKT